MKSFTELCFEQSDAGAVAQYMDDQMGEETLIKIFGAKPITYALIAFNHCMNYDSDYENLYANLIFHRPIKQEDFDNLISNLFEIEDNE